MISNTDSILSIYLKEHIRVKVYTGVGPRQRWSKWVSIASSGALAKDIVGAFGGSAGSVGKLVKGIDRDCKMSLDEGDSR